MERFHFISEKHGLDDIRERRLKISQIQDLNDPFELLPVELSNPEHRRVLHGFKEQFSSNRGMLCFSGLCLGLISTVTFGRFHLHARTIACRTLNNNASERKSCGTTAQHKIRTGNMSRRSDASWLSMKETLKRICISPIFPAN